MKGLFLKIFGWFWLTIIITISATYWISSQLFDNTEQSHNIEQIIDHYFDEIEKKLITLTLPEFLNWIEKQHFPRGIGVTLVDKKDSIVVTKGIKKQAIRFFQEHHKWPFQDNRRFKIKQQLIQPEQKLTLSVFIFPKRAHLDSAHPPPWFSNINKPTRGWGLIRFLIALTVSALVCYLLARYLTKPIIKLRNTVNSLGKGNFETNVAAQFSNRTDEISELAIDIDDMAAKLRDQFKQREDLLRDISHELRTPLARMRIASELIKSKTSKLELSEVFQLEADITVLDNLIGEILTFSRLSDKNRKLSFTEFDLKVLLQKIIENGNFEANPQHKKIVLQTQPQTSFVIKANEPLIQRALENVIRNAINYTPADTQVIVDLDNNSTLITVQISDEGPGVRDDQLIKIFEPFYRVSESRNRTNGGTGLGLAISKRAIELNNGKIFARNAEQQGLIITIQLYLSQANSI